MTGTDHPSNFHIEAVVMHEPKESNHAILELRDVVAVHSGQKPLYHSLGQFIRCRIQSGELAVGERIPSERDLVQMFNVSRATVRQGIDNLVKEGVLHRVRGKGTFVAAPKVKQGVLRLRDFSKTMKRSGLNPSGQFLGKQILIPPLDVQNKLNLQPTQKIVWIQRLVEICGEPIMIETCQLPADRFPELADTFSDPDQDLADLLIRQYRISISEERETFEPVILEESEAALLGVKQGFPALWVEAVAYDSKTVPVMARSNLLRGDRCRFYVDLAFA
jgi:GntR family transcriptional regulator